MEFLSWLHNQIGSKEAIGWLARLYEGQEAIRKEFESHSGRFGLKRYAETLPKSKISSTLIFAVNEWIKQSIKYSRVGIYWVIDGNVVDFSLDANEVPSISGFREGSYDHLELWPKVQSMFPSVKDKEYDELPRGRIVGVEPDTFKVFVPPDRCGDADLINKIIRAFSLPKNKVEIVSDIHYSSGEKNPFEDDD